MNKSEVRMSSDDRDRRELQGLQDGGVVTFECNDCGVKLLCLQLTSIKGESTAKVLTRVAVQCGLCGGFSSVEQISGKFHPGAPSDEMIFDVVDNDNDVLSTDVLFKAWRK